MLATLPRTIGQGLSAHSLLTHVLAKKVHKVRQSGDQPFVGKGCRAAGQGESSQTPAAGWTRQQDS